MIGRFFDWFEEHSEGILAFILALLGFGVVALLFGLAALLGGVR